MQSVRYPLGSGLTSYNAGPVAAGLEPASLRIARINEDVAELQERTGGGVQLMA